VSGALDESFFKQLHGGLLEFPDPKHLFVDIHQSLVGKGF
jgi:hypothetical protein